MAVFSFPATYNLSLGVQGTTYWNFVHVTVIDFYKEYGLPKWNGYRYWSVYTSQELNYFDIPENVYLEATNDDPGNGTDQVWTPIDAANTWNPTISEQDDSKFLLSIYQNSSGEWNRWGRDIVYQGGTDYLVDDIVSYSSKCYKCIQANGSGSNTPTGGASNNTWWQYVPKISAFVQEDEARSADPTMVYDFVHDKLLIAWEDDWPGGKQWRLRTLDGDGNLTAPIDINPTVSGVPSLLINDAGTSLIWMALDPNASGGSDSISYCACSNTGNYNWGSAQLMKDDFSTWVIANYDLSLFDIPEDAVCWHAEFKKSAVHQDYIDCLFTVFEAFNYANMSAYHFQVKFSALSTFIIETDQPLLIPGGAAWNNDSGCYRGSTIAYANSGNYALTIYADPWGNQNNYGDVACVIQGDGSGVFGDAVWADVTSISGDEMTLTIQGGSPADRVQYRWDSDSYAIYNGGSKPPLHVGTFNWYAEDTTPTPDLKQKVQTIVYSPDVLNNRESGGYNAGTEITLIADPDANLTPDSIQYGWGSIEPTSPATYSSGSKPTIEGGNKFWWRGVIEINSVDEYSEWQTADYTVDYLSPMYGLGDCDLSFTGIGGNELALYLKLS